MKLEDGSIQNIQRGKLFSSITCSKYSEDTSLFEMQTMFLNGFFLFKTAYNTLKDS
jgi:hypothetical protein